MGQLFSSISSTLYSDEFDNLEIKNFDRKYIALDPSSSLGSLYDEYQDTIMGELFIDLKLRASKVDEPIICELRKGRTSQTENLLEMAGIDCLLQLSLISKVVPPIGIASIINYPPPIDDNTRFLYFNQLTFRKSCYDDLLGREEVYRIARSPTSATHIITEISWGIHAIIVLQLPTNQVDEIDQLLQQIQHNLIDGEHALEMIWNGKSLCNQIISTAVYSNIPDLTKLTRLDDVYHRILRIRKDPNEHRRLSYRLTSMRLFDLNDRVNTSNDCEIDSDRIEQINRYLYQQCSQIKAMKFRFDQEVFKLLVDKLEEQLNEFQRDFSRLTELYKSDGEKIYRLIHCIRKDELMMNSIDEYFNSEAQIQIRDAIQRLEMSVNILISKGDFIQQLQNDRSEYWNVARLGIDQDYDEQLVKDTLFKGNRNKLLLCSTDQFNEQSSAQFNELYSQMTKERQNNPQVISVYADFTYSTWCLDKMIILSSKDQTTSTCPPTLEPPSLQSKAAVEDINILLLGDSGVGKSTFVNAFANYLRFDSLKQAKAGQPIVIIPVSFIMTVGANFDEHLIKFGEPDPNENHNDIGQSVTQHCRSYLFEISPGKTLRIIDTPGFADTRGDTQDQINMNMIVTFVNNLTHLNAVCLLFKPNVARLNPFLYSCFTEIFECFGEKIRDHLIFCFTTARSTFFVPGDTRPLLKAFFNSFPVPNIPFEKKNTFCFDSESFRYLVALQNKLKFDEDEEDEYGRSWTRSVEESRRLRNFLCEEVHPYRRNIEWQSIKNIHSQIESIVRPMLEAIRNILRNILLYNINRSIKLKATSVLCPTIICYKCDRIPKIFDECWVFPDLIHHSPSECSSNERTMTEYTLDYESLDNSINDSQDTLHQQQIFLCEAGAQFARFLQMTNARKDDLFLSGLMRMLDEEESICQKQNQPSFNQQLASKLQTVIKDYKQALDKTQLDEEKPLLAKIYDLIISVNEKPMVTEQIHAIREHQQFLLTSNERDLDIRNISS